MGGIGSGRTSGYPTSGRTESVRIDLPSIMRLLKPHPRDRAKATITYGEDGSKGFAEISLRYHPEDPDGAAFIRYEIEQFNRTITERTQHVSLISEPCRFGGRRWFFRCPATGRKCTKLFLPNGADHWRSRDGFKLAYDSQREDQIGRLHRRLGRLYSKIGQSYSGYETCWPVRPPRMRQTTFAKIEAAILRAEDQINGVVEMRLGGFLRRYGAIGDTGPL